MSRSYEWLSSFTPLLFTGVLRLPPKQLFPITPMSWQGAGLERSPLWQVILTRRRGRELGVSDGFPVLLSSLLGTPCRPDRSAVVCRSSPFLRDRGRLARAGKESQQEKENGEYIGSLCLFVSVCMHSCAHTHKPQNLHFFSIANTDFF